MSKKDEAAEVFRLERVAFLKMHGYEYNSTASPGTYIDSHNLIGAFKSGWTQGLEELMKMAREKAFELKFNDEPVKVVFIRDLEAIKLELERNENS